MSHQGSFAFTFTSEGAPDAFFQVTSFRLEEGLSECFTLELELVCADPALDFARVIDQPSLFTVWADDDPLRYVHGMVTALAQETHTPGASIYRATVEPSLARLACTSHWQVFQGLSVPQISTTLFKRHRGMAFEQAFSSDHAARDYCVQPGESDLAFLERLNAESGLYYAFAHSPEAHTLIQGDHIYLHGLIAGETVRFHERQPGHRHESGLWSLRYLERAATGQQPSPSQQPMMPTAGRPSAAHAFPGDDAHDAITTATPAITAFVKGNDARLQPGLAFDLMGHPRADRNCSWRVLRMTHHGTQRLADHAGAPHARQRTDYHYLAQLIPGRTPWSPPIRRKPRVDGPQIATVVGPAQEDIHCDELGRIKVQFVWDREGKYNAHSSCWVPVAQGWAGAGMGQMAVPRVGQDVVVAYLEGDCDRPIVIGSLFGTALRPPQELPYQRTRMTLRGRSTRGDTINELSFEDRAGQEEILLHAGRNMRSQVLRDACAFVGNDHKHTVERDDTSIVGNDARRNIGNDERVSIGQNQYQQVKHNATITVGDTQHVIVGKDKSESVGQHRRDSIAANHSISVGGNAWQVVQGRQRLDALQGIERKTSHYQLEARERIEIRAPGGSIVIDERGITLDGSAIRILAQAERPARTPSRQAPVVPPRTGQPAAPHAPRRDGNDGTNDAT